ncbi:hypothetical protein WMF18_41670 [Sorangium sp. So ce315]|uniref:hypothetical protein n=1 Tax=Sorangium sp. So ce315 TaxID=3133299 RepID=UPI003F5ECEF6
MPPSTARTARGATATTSADLLPSATPGGVTSQNGVVELTTFNASASPHAPSL